MPVTKELPLFEKYTIDELLDRLPYGLWTLTAIYKGRRRPTDKFIKTACGILNRTREELFGEVT